MDGIHSFRTFVHCDNHIHSIILQIARVMLLKWYLKEVLILVMIVSDLLLVESLFHASSSLWYLLCGKADGNSYKDLSELSVGLKKAARWNPNSREHRTFP